MVKKSKKAGFTLIELMIVVGILGILAAVAIAAYGAYVKRSRNAEATAILADIRVKQEAYRATFHQYANLAGTWLPDNVPSAANREWDNTVANAAVWNQLGVVPDSGLYFSYTGSGGVPGTGPTHARYEAVSDEVGIGDDWFTNDFWYGAAAKQDLDGDGNCEGFVVISKFMKIAERKATCAAF
ncbi:MAG: prepilin-type N-terminal cleavage/methylation domain-containing protein [Proteobacteria bacterium]|nr:prepilin-type N-terminal cleavage/methylation domain-containing protein [Pseudomonadota bacterium]